MAFMNRSGRLMACMHRSGRLMASIHRSGRLMAFIHRSGQLMAFIHRSGRLMAFMNRSGRLMSHSSARRSVLRPSKDEAPFPMQIEKLCINSLLSQQPHAKERTHDYAQELRHKTKIFQGPLDTFQLIRW